MSQYTGKVLLILEKSQSHIRLTNAEDYILEGVFAEFGKINKNDRIYEEEEYIPHLNEMIARIKERGGIMGELDHPESFDVSAKNASHVVEHLEYDQANRQVRGRIRLLTTPAGNTARALVNDGIRLGISSRAAGVVLENKHVEIKKIFTYDIVADPGFDNAQLNRINESVGFGSNSSVDIYDVGGIGSSPSPGRPSPSPKKITEKGMNNSEFITVENFDKYSRSVLKPMFDHCERMIENLEKKLSVNVSESVVADPEVGKMKAYLNYISEQINHVIHYCEHIAESHNKMDTVDLTNIKKELGYITKYTTDVIAPTLDGSIEFSDYLSENMSNLVAHSDHLVEYVNKSIDYTSNYLAPKIDANIQYAEHISEGVNSLNEDVGNVIGYADYLRENVENTVNEGRGTRRKKNGSINENHRNSTNRRKGNVSESIDSLLEAVKSNKVSKELGERNYTFMKYLGERKQNEFIRLNETEKTKVAKALNEKVYFCENDVLKIWDNALKPAIDPVDRWLSEIPTEIKPLWEKADNATKDIIAARASMYLPPNPSVYAIHEFWNAQGFNTVGTTMLNESNNSTGAKKESNVSNDDPYLASIMKQTASMFKK